MSCDIVLHTRLALYPFAIAMLLVSAELEAISADQSGSTGTALAYACAACHGPEGRSSGAIPPLFGMNEATLKDSLRAFRSGERSGTVMNRFAQGLDDRDIEAVATYFSSRRRR